MKFIPLLIFILLLSSPIQGKNKALRIREKKSENQITFFAKNLSSSVITLSFNVTPIKNAYANHSLPLTVIIPPKSEIEILCLKAKNKDKRWAYRYNYQFLHGNKNAKHDKNFFYRLPYASGGIFKVTQGYESDFSHHGADSYALDWAMPWGSPVYAARGGKVVEVEEHFDFGNLSKSFLEKGNFLLIEHSDGTLGNYAHFKKNGIHVKIGQKIKQGEFLGYSGNSGYSSSSHLHFDVRTPVNGYQHQTIPVKFHSSIGDTILEEGKSYENPNDTPIQKNKIFGEIVLCKRIDSKKEMPVKPGKIFFTGERIYLYMPLAKPFEGQIEITFTNLHNQRQKKRQRLDILKNWHYAYASIVLNKTPNPRGRWEVKIRFQGKKIKTLYFKVL